MFEILDRLGGTFYVTNFGSKTEMKIDYYAAHLTPLQVAIARFVAKKLGFGLLSEPPSSFCQKHILPKASEWRQAEFEVEGKCDWETVYQAIKTRFGDCGIWKKALKFIDEFIGENETDIPKSRWHYLLERGGKIDLIRLIESFAEEFVIPRSRIVFDFPDTDQSIPPERAEEYARFREDWSFDVIRSQLGGAGTFFRRFLTDSSKFHRNDDVPDSRFRFGWWNDWHDALWFCDSEVPFVLSDKGRYSTLGQFRLGYSRLDAPPDLGDYWHPSRIWFPPASE